MCNIIHNFILKFNNKNNKKNNHRFLHAKTIIWGCKTTCKYFLVILKKFYEITENSVKSARALIAASSSVFYLCNLCCFYYCQIALFHDPSQKKSHSHGRRNNSHKNTNSFSHSRSPKRTHMQVKELREKYSLTHIHIHASHHNIYRDKINRSVLAWCSKSTVKTTRIRYVTE